MVKRFFKGMRDERSLIGNIGQWLAVGMVLFAFYLMVQEGITRWQPVATGGALILTLATKAKHERR